MTSVATSAVLHAAVPALAAADAAASVTGHVATVGVDGTLMAKFGTFGFGSHAGGSLAVDPKGNIALLTVTGSGAGFGGDVGLTGQFGIQQATSVLQLEDRSIAGVVGGAVGIEGVQAGASSDSEGNVTVSLGTGEGAATTVAGVDAVTVHILACTPP